jgi:hypothetical protein
MRYIIILTVAILAIIFAPFLTIWSLNVLFPVLAIPYTLETWAAIVLMHATIRGIFTRIKE